MEKYLSGFSEQSDGNMCFLENRQRFLKKLSFQNRPLIILKQIHSDKILTIKNTLPENLTEGDAILTNRTDIAIGVLTADCLPIILIDKKFKGAGIIHAGRAGSLLNISGQAVKKFSTEFNVPPDKIFPAIGPGIGKCCYEIDEEILSPFQNQFPDLKKIAMPAIKGKWNLDLKAINKIQLGLAGIPEKNIRDTDLCTCCNAKYFSYRRNRTPERILNLVALTL